MNEINSIIILLFFFVISASAQSDNIKDYNQDGIKDTLRNHAEGDYFFARYIDGKTNQVYDFKESDFNRSEFISFVSVPKELMQSENEILLDSLKEDLFPYSKIKESIPPLEWILTAFESNHKIEEGYFSQFINVPLKWRCWYSEGPPTALFKVKTDTLNLPNYFSPDDLPKYGLLYYYGHNHIDDLHANPWYDSIYKEEEIEILKTKHGLILRKGYNYAWIFHTDRTLTRSPGKLRWKSIGKTLIHKHYIFLQHISPISGTNRVFVINMKNGNIGRLNLEDDFTYNMRY